MRISVLLIVNLIANGMTPQEIIEDYPDLESSVITRPTATNAPPLGQRIIQMHNEIDKFKREGVGVEPTDAGSAPPPTNFEDWGNHRATSPPAVYCTRSSVE